MALLAHHWGLTNAEVSVLGGGMGSQTWLVTRPGNIAGRWVAKLVEPGNARPLEGGLGLARLLAEAGIPAGAPVPARDGRDIADPAPEAFRLDSATGRCGVIDWSYLLHGPLLYDLASAVMYVGGPAHAAELVTAYLRHGPLDRAEVAHGLDVMLRFRWAVQANYFAWRIARNDLTGISGPEENEKGLEDARVALAQN